MTTDFYGHLGTTYLKKQMEHLSFGPAPADTSGASDEAGQGQRRLLGWVAPGSRRSPPSRATKRAQRPRLLPGWCPSPRTARNAHTRANPWKGSTRV